MTTQFFVMFAAACAGFFFVSLVTAVALGRFLHESEVDDDEWLLDWPLDPDDFSDFAECGGRRVHDSDDLRKRQFDALVAMTETRH